MTNKQIKTGKQHLATHEIDQIPPELAKKTSNRSKSKVNIGFKVTV